MEENRIQNLARRAIRRVHEGRERIQDVKLKVAEIRRNNSLSEEGKDERVKQVVEESREKISREIASSQQVARSERETAEGKVAETRSATPEEIEAARANLMPVIAASGERPEALLSAYRRRHESNADRHVIEEAARSVIDGGLGGPSFPEEFRNLQIETGAAKTEPEREADEEAARLRDLEGYLGNSANVLAIELNGAYRPWTADDHSAHAVAVAAKNTFERANHDLLPDGHDFTAATLG